MSESQVTSIRGERQVKDILVNQDLTESPKSWLRPQCLSSHISTYFRIKYSMLDSAVAACCDIKMLASYVKFKICLSIQSNTLYMYLDNE